MSKTITARIPLRVSQKLTQYCNQHGVTRTEAIVRALERYLTHDAGKPDAYALAADLIPAGGLLRCSRIRFANSPPERSVERAVSAALDQRDISAERP